MGYSRTVRIFDQKFDPNFRERFRAMASTYFRVANGVVVAFDVTSRESFEAIHVWLRQIRDAAPQSVRIILVGNKIDMEDRKVTAEEAKELADKLQIDEYFECSAKSGQGVIEAFDALVEYTLGIRKSKWAPLDEPVEQGKPEVPETQPKDDEKPDVVYITKTPPPSNDAKKCNC
jgi:GTPase SAR1 family protein